MENLIPSCPWSPRLCGEARFALLGMSRENGTRGQHQLQFMNSDVAGWQVPAGFAGLGSCHSWVIQAEHSPARFVPAGAQGR